MDKEKYGIKFDRRGLPGSTQMRLTKPYTYSELCELYAPYVEKGSLENLNPNEARLLETALGLYEGSKATDQLLRSEVRRLSGWIKKNSKHGDDCPRLIIPADSARPRCTCGLNAILGEL